MTSAVSRRGLCKKQECFLCCLVIAASVSIKHGLRTGYKIGTRYKTWTGKYGLGIKHGLRIKRGLRTADWV